MISRKSLTGTTEETFASANYARIFAHYNVRGLQVDTKPNFRRTLADDKAVAIEAAEEIARATNEKMPYVVVALREDSIRCLTNISKENLAYGRDMLLKAAARLAEMIGN